MRLRTVTAASLKLAFAQVREALGADAVILSTRDVPGGVEVRAAAEAPPPAATLPPPLPPGSLESRLHATLIEQLRSGPDPQRDAPRLQPFDQDRLTRTLAFHGTPGDLAARLTQSADASGLEDAALALAHALERELDFAQLPPVPSRPLALIGAPGAGKSVTAGKLAARAALAGAGVTLACADAAKAGARAQIEAFAALMGQGVLTARDGAELAAAFADPAQDGRVRLVDTPGCVPWAAGDLARLRDLIDAVGAEPVLVLAAGGDAAESADLAAGFADLGVARVIATRLDAARRLGGVLAAAAHGAALSAFGATPYLADGLVPASPIALARRILETPGDDALTLTLESARHGTRAHA